MKLSILSVNRFIGSIVSSAHQQKSSDIFFLSELLHFLFLQHPLRRNADGKFNSNRHNDYQQRNNKSVQHRLCAGAAEGFKIGVPVQSPNAASERPIQ